MPHRLDRDTTGVMMVGKKLRIAAALGKLFDGGQVHKQYLAMCVSQAPGGSAAPSAPAHEWSGHPPELILSTGHGRSAHGLWRVYSAADVGAKLPGKGKPVKSMETRLVQEGVQGGGLLVGAYPKTGRTHQIRLHCLHAGIPLVGDVRYNGPEVWGGARWGGHLLHARALDFPHPVTGVAMALRAPEPAWAKGDFEGPRFLAQDVN